MMALLNFKGRSPLRLVTSDSPAQNITPGTSEVKDAYGVVNCSHDTADYVDMSTESIVMDTECFIAATRNNIRRE